MVKNDVVLNEEGLRNKEFVNHKILDCIGDLFTCGYRMLANITCSQGSHYLTNELLKKYLIMKKISQYLKSKKKHYLIHLLAKICLNQ